MQCRVQFSEGLSRDDYIDHLVTKLPTAATRNINLKNGISEGVFFCPDLQKIRAAFCLGVHNHWRLFVWVCKSLVAFCLGVHNHLVAFCLGVHNYWRLFVWVCTIIGGFLSGCAQLLAAFCLGVHTHWRLFVALRQGIKSHRHYLVRAALCSAFV